LKYKKRVMIDSNKYIKIGDIKILISDFKNFLTIEAPADKKITVGYEEVEKTKACY